jgi:hypothetical protein
MSKMKKIIAHKFSQQGQIVILERNLRRREKKESQTPKAGEIS